MSFTCRKIVRRIMRQVSWTQMSTVLFAPRQKKPSTTASCHLCSTPSSIGLQCSRSGYRAFRGRWGSAVRAVLCRLPCWCIDLNRGMHDSISPFDGERDKCRKDQPYGSLKKQISGTSPRYRPFPEDRDRCCLHACHA
jgi:hypothetical protein